MQTGRQLRSLFVIILLHCNPVDPQQLWQETKHHLCDDLEYTLRVHHRINDPTPDQVYDYGLHLIDKDLRKGGKSLNDFAEMPRVRENWELRVGNELIAEQLNYDVPTLQQFIQHGLPTLNAEQLQLYNAVIDSVNSNHGGAFFVHSAGGCGKTYVCNLIAATVRAQRKIVLCVASSGIASLLLSGGRTAHSRFKIPISINEASTCNIKKGDPWHGLLRETSLIIWDEVPMQHRYVIECVDRSLRDLFDTDIDFGKITILFGGDFRQTLPVIPHGSREQIVGATFCRSHLWQRVQIFHLRTNMRLGRDAVSDEFANYLLQLGTGQDLNAECQVELPAYVRCPNNTVQGLIDALYHEILNPAHVEPLPDHYFLDRTILSAKNVDVDEINSTVSSAFPGENIVYTSADSVTEREYDYIPPEFLNTLNPSGFPLHKLELKKGVPLMLLRNLNPHQGLYNGTRMILVDSTRHVLQCRVLRREHEAGHQPEIVFIPRMMLEASKEDCPVPLRRLQFPVRIAFSMTINKSQGQSVQHVGLDLRTPIFSHGQLYVALSRCTHPHHIKAIFPPDQQNTKTTNIVFTEVLRGLL
jgi:PIF1-like helicase/Helicase